jgi:predicted XRE-type DNA-binding protein
VCIYIKFCIYFAYTLIIIACYGVYLLMTLKFYNSPFHVTHDDETANKIVMKMDLSIMLTGLIAEKKWTQAEAAQRLGVQQSRISDLMNSKIEKFTIDAMFDMLDKLGFKISWSMSSQQKATMVIKKAKAKADIEELAIS